MNLISGFSKLNRKEKTALLATYTGLMEQDLEVLKSSLSSPEMFEEIISNLSENYISNYILPFGIAPNFLINDHLYFVPMVTEESSVVAAAAYAAKFWAANGGFTSTIIGTKKSGHIYFSWGGTHDQISSHFRELKTILEASIEPILQNMVKRGGGLTGLQLLPKKKKYFTIQADFETIDSMGANLINSCLETMSLSLASFLMKKYPAVEEKPDIIMAILSNFTPECLVECSVECGIDQLKAVSGSLPPKVFAQKFATAVEIALENSSRAVTHNKGIFNGIDSVLMATGNDFRAVEACGHAYASAGGKYRALNEIEITEMTFKYTLRIPMAVGTVGGITSIHPMVKTALRILNEPSARELMQIVAAAGMASNFAAIRSLITEGIQEGHMKLHLDNILTQLHATSEERDLVKNEFKEKKVTYSSVEKYLGTIRK